MKPRFYKNDIIFDISLHRTVQVGFYEVETRMYYCHDYRNQIIIVAEEDAVSANEDQKDAFRAMYKKKTGSDCVENA